MKIKEGFMISEIVDSFVVLPTSSAIDEDIKLMELTKSGALLWEQLEKGCDEESLVATMLEKYDVSDEVARKDVSIFLNSLREQNMIEE